MNYPWIFEELAQKPGAVRDFKEEWQWTRFQVGGKLFAAICKDGAGNDALLTLKLPPEENRFLRNSTRIFSPATIATRNTGALSGWKAACRTTWCGS